MEIRCDYSTLTIPNDLSYLDIVTSYVRAVGMKLGFSQPDRERVEEATREAVTNAIRHAYDSHERATVQISCERVPLGMQVVVHDRGMPFDPRLIDESACVESVEDQDSHCGILHMKTWVDEVVFRNLGHEGKETVLVKYLKDRDITEYYAACDLTPYAFTAPESRKNVEPIDFTIRPIEPSEAVEVSRLIYRTRGYSHTFEDLYYPERVLRFIEAGHLYSLVAVTPDNEVAGHAALARWHTEPYCTTGELSLAAVKPEYRSHGLLNRFTAALIDKAKADGLWSVSGWAVTNHTFSQQAGHKHGLKDCTIQLGYLPTHSIFRGISEELTQRETVVVHFRYLEGVPSLELYPPAHHYEMIRRLSEHVGSPHTLQVLDRAPSVSLPQESVMQTYAFETMKVGLVSIKRHGRDAVVQIRSILHDLRLRPMDVIYLDLNLHDPWTSFFCERFEEMGFFFAGIFPGRCPADSLNLQYLNNVPIDYDKIKLAEEMGKELLAYIKGLDPNRT